MANSEHCPHGDTFHKRRLGSLYDPDKHCPYTGALLYSFTFVEGTGAACRFYTLWYRSTDGFCLRHREYTPDQVAAFKAAWPGYQDRLARFKAWLAEKQK